MNLVELAQRIRRHRLNRQFTLEDVATRSGLTRRRLSKVENFRMTPSLPALGQIASAFSVTVAELVQGLDEKPTLIKVANDERKFVERDKSKTNTTVDESLAYKRPDRSMDPFLMVQQGTINFEFDGKVHLLSKGDCRYFESHVPHRIINPQKREATVLCVLFEPGQSKGKL